MPLQRGPALPEPPARPGPAGPRHWERRYARGVRTTDALVVALVVAVGIVTGLGGGPAADRARLFSGVVAGLLVLGALAAFRAWEPRVLGAGAEEFRRLLRGFAAAVVLLGLFALATQIQSVRVWVFGFVPLACVLCAAGRQGLRGRLRRARRAGHSLRRVLAVGTDASVADLLARTRRDPAFGWQVVAACTPTGLSTPTELPVVGDLDGIAAAARATLIDVVAIAPTPGFGAGRLQQLAWDLEGTGATLAVDPGVMEIAGPRLHITPVDGMPLLRLSKPQLGGSRRLAKEVLDRMAAAVLVVVLLPVLVGIAVALRCRGPVLCHRDRVGRDGVPFRMLGFRATPGGVLDRWSLDVLPRLFNVLGGSMSLVGPRAACPAELDGDADSRRRLLVKPGLTGPWQTDDQGPVLDWDASMRLELRYVENWSTTLDLAILWRTLGAVRRRGAQPAGVGAPAAAAPVRERAR